MFRHHAASKAVLMSKLTGMMTSPAINASSTMFFTAIASAWGKSVLVSVDEIGRISPVVYSRH